MHSTLPSTPVHGSQKAPSYYDVCRRLKTLRCAPDMLAGLSSFGQLCKQIRPSYLMLAKMYHPDAIVHHVSRPLALPARDSPLRESADHPQPSPQVALRTPKHRLSHNECAEIHDLAPYYSKRHLARMFQISTKTLRRVLDNTYRQHPSPMAGATFRRIQRAYHWFMSIPSSTPLPIRPRSWDFPLIPHYDFPPIHEAELPFALQRRELVFADGYHEAMERYWY